MWFLCFDNPLYFPAQLEGDFALLSDLLDY